MVTQTLTSLQADLAAGDIVFNASLKFMFPISRPSRLIKIYCRTSIVDFTTSSYFLVREGIYSLSPDVVPPQTFLPPLEVTDAGQYSGGDTTLTTGIFFAPTMDLVFDLSPGALVQPGAEYVLGTSASFPAIGAGFGQILFNIMLWTDEIFPEKIPQPPFRGA